MALKPFDLLGTIADLISVDEFEPKTGTNNELIVIAFYALDEEPAKDLDSYLERSFIEVIDVEVSPNPNPDGYYLVFIELKRNNEFFETFDKIIKDVQRVAGKQEWKISPYLSDKMYRISDDRWKQYVIIDPAQYVPKKQFDANKDLNNNIKEYFSNSGLSNVILEDKQITFVGSRNEKVFGKLLAFCSNDKLVESYNLKSEPLQWNKTSPEQKMLKECLGYGWDVVHHNLDLIISNTWDNKVVRIKLC